MNINEKVIYIGSYAENPHDLPKDPFRRWLVQHVKLSGSVPKDLDVSVSTRLPAEFSPLYPWIRQVCLPPRKRYQRLLPWARKHYYEITHVGINHFAPHRPGNVQSWPLYDWCLCLRWPSPLRRIAKTSLYECAIYWHRVGECPCMEYASWYLRVP